MLPRFGGAAWLEERRGEAEEDARGAAGDGGDEMVLSSFPSFTSLLEDDWYMNPAGSSAAGPPAHLGFEHLQTHQDIKGAGFHAGPSPAESLLSPPVGPSQSQPETALSSLLNAVCSDPFDPRFDLACDELGFLAETQMSNSYVLSSSGGDGGILGLAGSRPQLSPGAEFQNPRLLQVAGNDTGSSNGPGFNPVCLDAKFLKPLEIYPPVGSQPNLFQKRAAALCQNPAAAREESLGLDGEQKKRIRWNEDDEMDEGSIDMSGLNYDLEDVKNGGDGNGSNMNSMAEGGGDLKGKKKKKKGSPAKNLMAERRRRKKLNDRLYMLRSVVPKISKMDRASILGDAIEYMKELLQRIEDLHNELELAPGTSSLSATSMTNFHPSTPTRPTLPCHVKEEPCPRSSLSPNSLLARVEVREGEGQVVNIHMSSPRNPSILLSTMRAFDGLGLDIQQAVISCFNGFVLDVFRAEQRKDGCIVPPEEIKAALLRATCFHIGT